MRSGRHPDGRPARTEAQEDILLGHLQDEDAVVVVGRGMFLSRDGLALVELDKAGTEDVSATS